MRRYQGKKKATAFWPESTDGRRLVNAKHNTTDGSKGPVPKSSGGRITKRSGPRDHEPEHFLKAQLYSLESGKCGMDKIRFEF